MSSVHRRDTFWRPNPAHLRVVSLPSVQGRRHSAATRSRGEAGRARAIMRPPAQHRVHCDPLFSSL